MKTITYRPHGVCASRMDVAIDGERISEVKIHGGCAGNTQAVASLVVGMTVEEALGRIRGIRCGFKPTSCPDQLANALEACLALGEEEVEV